MKSAAALDLFIFEMIDACNKRKCARWAMTAHDPGGKKYAEAQDLGPRGKQLSAHLLGVLGRSTARYPYRVPYGSGIAVRSVTWRWRDAWRHLCCLLLRTLAGEYIEGGLGSEHWCRTIEKSKCAQKEATKILPFLLSSIRLQKVGTGNPFASAFLYSPLYPYSKSR